VSRSRHRSCRICSRTRSWRVAHTFEEAMALDDGEFKLWLANRANLVSQPVVADELSALRTEVDNLRRQVRDLSKAIHQRGSSTSRGLDVTTR
jgi:hypothetical protein